MRSCLGRSVWFTCKMETIILSTQVAERIQCDNPQSTLALAGHVQILFIVAVLLQEGQQLLGFKDAQGAATLLRPEGPSPYSAPPVLAQLCRGSAVPQRALSSSTPQGCPHLGGGHAGPRPGCAGCFHLTGLDPAASLSTAVSLTLSERQRLCWRWGR